MLNSHCYKANLCYQHTGGYQESIILLQNLLYLWLPKHIFAEYSVSQLEMNANIIVSHKTG